MNSNDSLVAQWYNALTEACHLDRNAFQLMQGSLPVGRYSDFIWNLFDAIPPYTCNHYYDPSQLNAFSANYGSIINNLNPYDQDKLGKLIRQYQKGGIKKGTSMADTILQKGDLEFSTAIIQKLIAEGAQASPAAAKVAATANNDVTRAITMWLDSGGSQGPKPYNGTIDDLKHRIADGQEITVTYDSESGDEDVTNTWARGKIAPMPKGKEDDIPYAKKIASQVREVKAALTNAATYTVTTVFQKYIGAFTLFPLSIPSTDPALADFIPWYYKPALVRSYQYNNYKVWKRTAPTWSDMFGPQGAFLRVCKSLVVVDGVTQTIRYSSAGGKQKTATLASKGTTNYPFLTFINNKSRIDIKKSTSGGSAKAPGNELSGQCDIYTPLGNPFVLGVNVIPIDAYLEKTSEP